MGLFVCCVFHTDDKLIINPDSHANSIDKTASGDYLLSARDTSTIYLISGVDGRILWRLGGKYSNFTMQETLFSNQHDARVQSENSTTMIVTLLDNAVSMEDMHKNSSTTSSALVLALDKTSWTATTLYRYPRPDGRFTRIRGNFQSLPGGSSLAHWSDNNYFSEYDAQGRMVLEAQLQSRRFESYRTYKFNWTCLSPAEEPAIKAIAYGTDPKRATTAMYVSWNGATEVAAWRFYNVADGSEQVIAKAERTKFETVAMVDGHIKRVRARAFDAYGNELGASMVVHTESPATWSRDHETVSQDPTPELENLKEGDDGHARSNSPLKSCTASLAVVDLTRSTCTGAIPSDGSLMTLAALMAIASGVVLALIRRRRRMARCGMARKLEGV